MSGCVIPRGTQTCSGCGGEESRATLSDPTFSKQMAHPAPTHREKWRPTPCQPSKGKHMVHAPGLWLLASCAPAPESSTSRDLDPPHMERSPLSQRPCNPGIMDTERDQRTEKILDLTLEILHLLTGEGHMVVKKESAEHSEVADGSYRPATDPPLTSPLLEQKILGLTNQIIRLLTGETSRDLDPPHMERSPLSQRPCNPGIMDTERDQRTEKILDLTLEILHLLTGEGHMVVKKPSECAEHSNRPHAILPSSAVQQQILDLTNQIIRLLTGEVPIRCEDVTVHLSMEKWGYVERQKVVVMADHQPLASEFGREDENKTDDGGKYMESGEAADEHPESLTHLSQNPNDSALMDRACADSEDQPASYDGGKLPSAVTKTDGKSPLTPFKGAVREVVSMDTHNPNDLDRLQSRKGNSSDPSEATVCKSESLNEEKEDRPEKPFLCTVCGKRYSHRQTLRVHLKHHRGEYIYTCSECGKGFNQSSRFVAHQLGHVGLKPFSCPCCGKGFTTESSAIAHQRIHTGEKPFQCSECKKCFHTKHYLTLHQRMHMDERPFKCEQCGKSFKIKQSLKRHQTIHSNQTAFICCECGRGFKHHSGLESHQRVHTGEHPFECKECDRSYSSKSGLVYHSLSHKGEKPFRCDECGKCFVLKQALVKHQKIHTGEKPFSCRECGKGFIQYSHLVVHERNHRGEKPFICPECGKGFSCKGYLASHRIVHVGEKQFKCNECGKCFSRRFALVDHQKSHANNLNI